MSVREGHSQVPARASVLGFHNIEGNAMLRNYRASAIAMLVFASGIGLSNQSSQAAEITVPTLVMTIDQMAPANANSSASFVLHNGGKAVVLRNAGGDMTVHQPTEIRFVFDPAGTKDYAPVGIAFKQTSGGTSDKAGTRNFPTRNVADGVLTIRADKIDLWAFKYSIIFERRTDGAIGVIDPEVLNEPELPD